MSIIATVSDPILALFNSAFRSKLTSNCEVELSGVKSHNLLGLGEWYHKSLRRIYRKIRHDAHDLDRTLVLHLFIKLMNDTIKPECNVPSYLVFRNLPKFPDMNISLPGQCQRMQALDTARKKHASIIARLHINLPPRSGFPFSL